MTEGQTLFVILSLLYLSDCLVWIGRKTVLFSSRWCYRWRSTFFDEYFGIAEGSVALLNPLPPLGSNFLGHWIPISISPTGICDFTIQTLKGKTRAFQTGMVLRFEEIFEAKTEGKYLFLNGSRFTKCCTIEQAAFLAELIKNVSSSPTKKREKLIREALVVQFSKDEALNHHSRVNNLTDGIRWTCSAFLIFLYVITPMIVRTYGLTRFIIPVAIVMFISSFFISVTYFRVHKALNFSHSHERMSNVLKMVLCPPTAIRAVDLLTLNSMSRFHPVLIASILLGPDILTFAHAVIADLKYPIYHDLDDPLALSIVSWYAAYELETCTKFLEEEYSTTLAELLAPPSWDGLSSVYCPRCSSQFTTQLGECPDCPGVALVPFPDTQTSGETHE